MKHAIRRAGDAAGGPNGKAKTPCVPAPPWEPWGVGLLTPQGFAADAETYAARTHKELAAGCPA